MKKPKKHKWEVRIGDFVIPIVRLPVTMSIVRISADSERTTHKIRLAGPHDD